LRRLDGLGVTIRTRHLWTGFAPPSGLLFRTADGATTTIDADAVLLAKAKEVAAGISFAPWPADVVWPKLIPHRAPEVFVGPLASSEIWTQNLDRLDVLHARHQSLSEDNESGAFAHVASIHDIPFLSVKDIANNEYYASSALAEFSDFPTGEVGKRAASLIAALIKAL
jgi:nucleoside phosphorylase